MSLEIRSKVSAPNWIDGTFIQTYFEFLNEPRSLPSFTCNVQYDIGASFAETRAVYAYSGDTSLALHPGKWNSIAENDLLPDDDESWGLVEADYTTSTEGDISSQWCYASTILYELVDGIEQEAVASDYRSEYLELMTSQEALNT